MFEDGVDWKPIDPQDRGRYATFGSAVDAVLKDLTTERNGFFDSLADRWPSLFPGLPIRPGRCEDGVIYVYVPNAPLNFAMRPKLPAIKRALSELPGAPKRLVVKMEIRK